MNELDAYQSQALQTAIYPLERGLEYTVLGLLSEIGELEEVYYDVTTERGNGRYWTARQLSEGLSEAGDCYWYLAAIADSVGTTLGQLELGERAIGMEFHNSRGLTLSALTREAGAIAGVVKKSIRDDGGALSKVKREQIEYHLPRVLALLDHFSTLLGSNRKAVMTKNLNKLSDRKVRGTLEGSGNHR